MTAIYLVEYGTGRLKRAITFFVDVMTGIPSIVAGLFAFALFTLLFGNDVRMGVMGAVALSVLMIPVVVRSCEEVLKLVPNELREAAYALGVPKWRTVVKVVLPTAIAGLGTGVTLAVARVVGETAPLLVTVGLINATNFNPFDGRMATLPVFAYYQLTQPGTATQAFLDRAWTAALVLIILVMALNVVARLISRFFAPRPVADRTDQEDITWPSASRSPTSTSTTATSWPSQGVTVSIEPRSITAPDRPVRLREVDVPAVAQPHARGDPGRPRRGQGRHRRPGPLRRRRRPGRRAPADRHGLPAAQPVPDDVDLRQRRRRAAAERHAR